MRSGSKGRGVMAVGMALFVGAYAGIAMADAAVASKPAAPAVYPSPPAPNYGPLKGSISFIDTDPGETIGGKLTMRPAVDEHGKRVDAAANGITMYMIHWGLEVGGPGTGDLGGDCKGFRDTGHVVMAPAVGAPDLLTWDIPKGTAVPKGAVYFVGHTLYGNIHNLAKCTQTPIVNLIVH